MRVDGVEGGELALTETAEELAVMGDDMFTEEVTHLSGCVKKDLMIGGEKVGDERGCECGWRWPGSKKDRRAKVRYAHFTRKGKDSFL